MCVISRGEDVDALMFVTHWDANVGADSSTGKHYSSSGACQNISDVLQLSPIFWSDFSDWHCRWKALNAIDENIGQRYASR